MLSCAAAAPVPPTTDPSALTGTVLESKSYRDDLQSAHPSGSLQLRDLRLDLEPLYTFKVFLQVLLWPFRVHL